MKQCRQNGCRVDRFARVARLKVKPSPAKLPTFDYYVESKRDKKQEGRKDTWCVILR